MRAMAMFLGLAAGSLAAQGAVAAEPAASVPPRSVSCTYDALTPDTRNLALELMPRSTGDTAAEGSEDSREAILKLIGAAYERCLDAHSLTSGESETMRAFALHSLFADFTAKTIVEDGGNPSDVVAFRRTRLPGTPTRRILSSIETANLAASVPSDAPLVVRNYFIRKAMAQQSRMLTSAERTALISDLKVRGWKLDEPVKEERAAYYLWMQMQLAFDRQAFTNGGYAEPTMTPAEQREMMKAVQQQRNARP